MVFLYPAASVLVKSSGGFFLITLALAGLVSARDQFRFLRGSERTIFIGFFLLFFVVAISLVNTDNYREGFKAIERFIHFPLVVFAYFYLRKSDVDFKNAFIAGIYFAVVVYFFVAIVQTQFLGFPRAQGYYYPILFGDLSVMYSLFILAYIFTGNTKGLGTIISVVCVILGLSAVVFSGTKGALLVLPIALPVLIWLGRKQISRTQWMAAGVACIVFAGAFFVLGGQKQGQVNLIFSQFKSLSNLEIENTGSTFSARYSLWRDAYYIWKENPILGTGVGDFEGDAQARLEQGLSYPDRYSGRFDHAHSVYFDALASIGIVGLIVLLGTLFALPLRYFIQRWKDAANYFALAGVLLVLCYFVFGLTEAWTYRNPFVKSYLIFFILLMCCQPSVKHKGGDSFNSDAVTT